MCIRGMGVCMVNFLESGDLAGNSDSLGSDSEKNSGWIDAAVFKEYVSSRMARKQPPVVMVAQ